VKRGTPDHRKMKDLARRLKIPLPYAVGIMEMLWHQVSKYAIQGDVGKWPDEAIAEAVHWKGDTDKLVNALVDSGWLDRDPDYRLVVHDWDQHADQSVCKTLKNKGLGFVTTTANYTIYFLRSKATGLIKIGTTRRNVRDRIGELQVSSGERLELLATFSAGFQTEAELHARFSNWKTKGEWFTPCDELIDLIALINENSGMIPELDGKVKPALALAFPKPEPKPEPEPVVDGGSPPTPPFRETVETAWENHRHHRNGETLDHAVRIILSAERFDWRKFSERHPKWCEYWGSVGWGAYGTLTFVGWIQAGMPLPPARASPAKQASKLELERELERQRRKQKTEERPHV
jgi:hypothetical protein